MRARRWWKPIWCRDEETTDDRQTQKIMETKIVLKNRQTKNYLCENDSWTETPALARRFETPYHALYFCVSKELEGLDIVFRLPHKEIRFLRC